MGVERVVRRLLSGSEGELWQLSDDMKGAPSVVVGLPPAVRQTQKLTQTFKLMYGRKLFATGVFVKG